MANYKNQNRININEDLGKIVHPAQTDSQFLIALEWEPLLNIMTDLTAPEFMLWEYILKWRGPRKENNNQRYYDFSPADLHILFGWSENSARKYLKELEKKRYIISQGKNSYVFVPYPEEVQGRAAIIREKRRNKNIAENQYQKLVQLLVFIFEVKSCTNF